MQNGNDGPAADGGPTERTTIDVLIGERIVALGISRGEFARRLGFKYSSKTLRRLDWLAAGEFERTKEFVARLPVALDLPPEQVEAALERTRLRCEEGRRQAAEAEEAAWRAGFVPHAILIPERSVPSPIFLAALIGVERLLRIDFDLARGRASFVRQTLAQIPESISAFGKPIGFVINYSSDRAIRFDLEGNAVELLHKAVRPAQATLFVGRKRLDLGLSKGEAERGG